MFQLRNYSAIEEILFAGNFTLSFHFCNIYVSTIPAWLVPVHVPERGLDISYFCGMQPRNIALVLYFFNYFIKQGQTVHQRNQQVEHEPYFGCAMSGHQASYTLAREFLKAMKG
jgi:hypothetical protein